jgi:hypothetical protein
MAILAIYIILPPKELWFRVLLFHYATIPVSENQTHNGEGRSPQLALLYDSLILDLSPS